ncbi:hypothetical protein D3C87_361470 [compost metagenome]
MKKLYLFTLCFAFFSYQAVAQTKRYVKTMGTGDGSSWGSASGNLQAMINASAPNDEVWVASGIYKPTEKIDASGGVRDVSFILKAGVKIYGGFVGDETFITERILTNNETILSGDLNNSNSANDGDAYHVIVSTGNSNGAVLDGFTIQHGFANIATELIGIARNQGAGINITNETTSIVFKNLVIRNNQSSINTPIANGGAGAYLKLSGSSSNCTFENVTFNTNTAAASGGNIYFTSVSGSPVVTVLNSKIFGGRGTGGAGIYTVGTDGNIPLLNVYNTIFSENRATAASPSGGGIYLGGFSNTNIVNCTFYNNSGSNGGGVGYGNFASTVLNLYNNIFNGNTVSTSNLAASDIRNLTGTTMDLRSNLFQSAPPEDTDPVYRNIINPSPSPLFLSTTITDANFLKIVEGAATEKGDNSYATTYGLTTDLAGEARLKHTNVDLGAYEYQGTLPVSLESFTAKKVNTAVQLNWKIASELNNDRFVIERSTDRIDFQKLKDIQSKGDTQNTVLYSYTDYTPLKGNNYYRLSQVDKDGTSKILAADVVKFDLSNLKIATYPNPATNFIKLKLNDFEGAVNVKLISLLGQKLLSKRFEPSQEIYLDIRNINAGNYVLLIETSERIYSHKTTIVR